MTIKHMLAALCAAMGGTGVAQAAPETPQTIPASVPAQATTAQVPVPATSRARPDHQPPAGILATASPTPALPPVRRTLAELASEHDGAASEGEQFDCLASAIYFEARGEPLEGQLAVAEVILNRVRSGRFRGTVCDVVTQPSQFSFVRRGVIPDAPRASTAWRRAAAIAHIAMNDLADATGDASLFFHAARVNPGWGRPRVARIGNHIFYR